MRFYFQILKILPNYNQLTYKEERAAGVGDVVSK